MPSSSHTSEYARLFELVRSDVTDFAMSAYNNHFYLLQIVGGVFIVYLFYRFGRMLNRSNTASKIEVLNSFEESKEKLSERQLQIVKRLRNFKMFLKVLSVLMIAVNIYIHVQDEQVNRWLIRHHVTPLSSILERAALSVICLLLMVVLWVSVERYQKYVDASTNCKLKNLEKEESSEFDSLIKILGEQAIRRIKLKLCKEVILKLNRDSNMSVCTKERCTEEKKLLEDSYKIHNSFIRKVLEFKWCNVCSQRRHAEKLKEISAVESVKVYPSEKDEVREKTITLQIEATKLVKFLEQLCHSHCSARFWKYSREVGRDYMRQREANQQQQNTLEKLKPNIPAV